MDGAHFQRIVWEGQPFLWAKLFYPSSPQICWFMEGTIKPSCVFNKWFTRSTSTRSVFKLNSIQCFLGCLFLPRGYVKVPIKVRSLAKEISGQGGHGAKVWWWIGNAEKINCDIPIEGWTKRRAWCLDSEVLHDRWKKSFENFIFWSESQWFPEVWWMHTKTFSCFYFCWYL